MEPLSAILFAGGLLLVGVVLFDALCTAIALGGGGPLTMRLASGLWGVALRWHRRREHAERHHLLAGVGPVILVVIIVTWILLLWAGFWLLFSVAPEAVVNARTDAPANAWERLYFVGFTVSTLGIGDFAPQGTLWRIITPVAALSGFLLLTLSITYLLPVVSAVVEKRQLAASISSLGWTPQEILRSGWDGESLGSLEQPLISLAQRIEVHAQRHLAYPVLHFFHSTEKRTAVAPRLAALSEALELIRQMPPEAQPPPASVRAARGAIDGFMNVLGPVLAPSPAQRTAPEPPAANLLREAGLPIGEASPDGTGSLDTTRRRRLLRAFVEDDGWCWTDVTG